MNQTSYLHVARWPNVLQLLQIFRRQESWGFADQIIISISNFVTMVILARSLGATSLGVFVLAFTLLMFVGSIQFALITQPHNILGPLYQGDGYRSYSTSILLIQCLFSLITGAMSVVAGLIVIGLQQDTFGWSLIALGPLLVTCQLQECTRRMCYTEFRYREAVFISLGSYGLQIAAALVLWQKGAMSPATMIMGMAVAFGVGALIGISQVKLNLLLSTTRKQHIEHLRRTWDQGRWLVGATISAWLSGQLYPVLAAGFVGLAAAGGIRSAQTMVAPALVLVRTINSVAPSRASLKFEQGGWSALRVYLRRIGVPSLTLLVAILIPLSLLAAPLLTILVGAEYSTYAWLVAVLAVAYTLEFTATIATVALQSIDRTSTIMLSQTLSAGFVLTFGVAILWQFGIVGAAAGMILHGILLNISLWIALRRFLRQYPQIS
jgi:O-antigen/teichoic acid export membrane protein